MTIVGKNEIDNRENVVGPFLVHKLLGPRPSPLPPPPLLTLPLGGGGVDFRAHHTLFFCVQVRPAVVIVEEAAEVLEPQLMACLGPWV